MKLVKTGLALFMVLISFSGIHAQTVDEIVNKYVAAMGGKDKIQQIKTVYMENTTQVMGNEGPSTINLVNGVGYKMVSEINGQTIIMTITEKGGWQVNPYAGASTPTALPDDLFKQNRARVNVTGPLYDYAAKGNKLELQGKDGNAYKIKVTDKDSVVTTVYIDTASYYMTKVITSANFMGQTMDIISSFSDFKKGDLDIVFPYAIEISYGGQFSVTTTVKKIELNKKIDPAIFDMPKS